MHGMDNKQVKKKHFMVKQQITSLLPAIGGFGFEMIDANFDPRRKGPSWVLHDDNWTPLKQLQSETRSQDEQNVKSLAKYI